jgi:hypothetical protein
LLRIRIKEIADDSRRKYTFSANDLNDSLDFQQLNEYESKKIGKIREEIYEESK